MKSQASNFSLYIRVYTICCGLTGRDKARVTVVRTATLSPAPMLNVSI